MSTKKMILINGIARGGTNVLWNIMQSHPLACSPIYETLEVLNNHRRYNKYYNFIWYKLTPFFPFNFFLKFVAKRKFEAAKLMNFGHVDNGYKFEGVVYTKKEVKNAILCLKSVNYEVDLTDFLMELYPEAYAIGIIRNGYAVCESWTRRGASPSTVGKIYKDVMAKILSDSKNKDRYRIVRFEDMMERPFEIANELYEFVNVEPSELEKIRLKAKNILKDDGEHSVKYGIENRKYWFGKDEIDLILDPDISSRQEKALSEEMKNAFDKEAGDVWVEIKASYYS